MAMAMAISKDGFFRQLSGKLTTITIRRSDEWDQMDTENASNEVILGTLHSELAA
jgi:hypothetical protein